MPLFGAHSKIDSIVLTAPVADGYACCSRFEELPRFIMSLREVQRIGETHFAFSAGRQRIQDRFADRAPHAGAANCLASHAGRLPAGGILFEPLSNRTTEVAVRLRSSIEPATLAKVTRAYLTNFKRDDLSVTQAPHKQQIARRAFSDHTDP